MTDQRALAYAIQCDLWPTDGTPKSLRLALDFTGGVTSQDLDIVLETANNTVESVQGIFVDNSDSTVSLTLTFKVNQHRIVIPAGQQGTFPVFGGSPLQMTAASASGIVIPVHLLNVPTPWNVWGPVSISGTGGGSLPVNPLQTIVEVKTALALNGANQVLLAANAARKALQIMAPSGNAGIVQLAIGGATGALGTDYEITPGGVWQPPAGTITQQAINVKGTAADNIVALEG